MQNARNKWPMLIVIGLLTMALATVLSMKNVRSLIPATKTAKKAPTVREQVIEHITKNPAVQPQQPPKSGPRAVRGELPFFDQINQSSNAEAKIVDAGKKAACRMNVSIINNAVEQWAVLHDGQWPREDLSDMARDRDYFPNGIPRCPVDGSRYQLDPHTKRIAGHTHPEIPDITSPDALLAPSTREPESSESTPH